ncbi:hypothetical protein AB0958_35915 [Streptomyces sp. NPDC006655]|uniref:hypothetical protein n=1 Tax=Streptomyces sp. NPDC006655 TaxID=3156898 RepID=UPI00345710E1
MTTTTAAPARTREDAERLPGAWTIGLRRGAPEIRQFFRQRDQVVFTFALPLASSWKIDANRKRRTTGKASPPPSCTCRP